MEVRKMGERIGAPINPVQVAMPKIFVERYIAAISEIIPLDILARAQQIVEAHRPPGVTKDSGPFAIRILLVDDDPDAADSYKTMGALVGNTVIIVSSASKAEELIRPGEFDRIVVDGLQGEWVNVWRKGTQEGIETIVFSSGEQIIRAARQMGAKAVLKDIDEENFRQTCELFRSK